MTIHPSWIDAGSRRKHFCCYFHFGLVQTQEDIDPPPKKKNYILGDDSYIGQSHNRRGDQRFFVHK